MFVHVYMYIDMCVCVLDSICKNSSKIIFIKLSFFFHPLKDINYKYFKLAV